MPVTVRPYRPEDLEGIIDAFFTAVRRVARRDYSEDQVRAWATGDADRGAWARRREGRLTWVAEADGRVAGFTDLEPDGHLDMMFVHADFQRRGVAKALAGELLAAARAQGMERVFAEVSITARPFFESLGFTVVASQTVEVRGQSFVNYRMEKRTA